MSGPTRVSQPSQDALTGTGPGDSPPLTDSARQVASTIGTYSCGGCDTRWPGISRCHCSGCHQTFSGLELFDKHRRERHGDGYCIPPEDVVNREGIRQMFITNGIWHGIENPTPRVPPKRRKS